MPEDLLSELTKDLGYESVFDYNEAINELTKLSLFEKGRGESNSERTGNTFNMHDLTQLVLLDMQSLDEKKQAIKTNLALFSRTLRGGWDKITKQLVERPHLLAHIETLCYHAQSLKVYDSSLIELMTYLLEYHMYHTRDQATYEKLVKHIHNISKSSKNVSPLVLARSYSDRVYARGIFKENIKKDFEKAIEIFKSDSNQTEELFRAYTNFAQYFLIQGNFEKSFVNVKRAEEIIHKVKSESYKNLFYFAKAWILSEYGNYKESLQNINYAINNLEKEENEALRIYIKNMKAWADLKNGNYEEAYRWAEATQKRALEFFDKKNNDSIAWTTLIKGIYKEIKGDYKGAEEDIKESLERLERYYDGPAETEDQAHAHVVLGDIYLKTARLTGAKNEYQLAEKIYDLLYTKKEAKGLSDLYVRLAILGARLKDDFFAKHYLDLHNKYFEHDREGTQEIFNAFQENNLEILP